MECLEHLLGKHEAISKNFTMNGGAEVLMEYGWNVMYNGVYQDEPKVAAALTSLLRSNIA